MQGEGSGPCALHSRQNDCTNKRQVGGRVLRQPQAGAIQPVEVRLNERLGIRLVSRPAPGGWFASWTFENSNYALI
jgi:hypothetical protein